MYGCGNGGIKHREKNIHTRKLGSNASWPQNFKATIWNTEFFADTGTFFARSEKYIDIDIYCKTSWDIYIELLA